MTDKEKIKTVRKGKSVEYINEPAVFDIEVSSFYEGEDKKCCMYAFVIGINGKVYIGRHWNDFLSIINKIISNYELKFV